MLKLWFVSVPLAESYKGGLKQSTGLWRPINCVHLLLTVSECWWDAEKCLYYISCFPNWWQMLYFSLSQTHSVIHVNQPCCVASNIFAYKTVCNSSNFELIGRSASYVKFLCSNIFILRLFSPTGELFLFHLKAQRVFASAECYTSAPFSLYGIFVRSMSVLFHSVFVVHPFLKINTLLFQKRILFIMLYRCNYYNHCNCNILDTLIQLWVMRFLWMQATVNLKIDES